MWPSPPEQPRYAYIGDLVGESNFQDEIKETKQTAQRIWEFIAGIIGNNYEPVVLERPQSVVADSQGNVFTTDVGRQAVVAFKYAQGEMEVWYNADRSSGFATPVGITLTNSGTLLVTDAERKEVFELDTNGSPLSQFGKGALERPTGIAQDPATGFIYVADTQADNIKVFNAGGELIDTIGASGDAPGLFNAPTHLSIRGQQLYVADTLNARIQIVGLDGTPQMTVGQRGINVGQFSRPKGVATDSEGNIYAMESYFDHLLVFSPKGEFLLPIGGTGVEAGHFFLPAGIWVDSTDKIYIADMMNGRIAIFQYLGSGNE
ncbi:6-bladed beta-propeller [Aestuariirhabdus litorea]|uniref:6-bladed beta-propeller n=2 Tax=Aestuariirhabdus litorea TaxID=2528527 RepID=A0A3P3VT59_9GAMM|nr:6-bladed beta-propeller [Aestuariirhabdus litorea]RWW98728.1 6-bladed beta-propeller [Endozoicomonadaceae bacterium GTF-13]